MYFKKSKLVVFLGPDGAGKSTILELVVAGLEAKGEEPKTFYFAPGYMKRYRPSTLKTVTTDPHGRPAYGPLLIFFKILLMLVEFNLGVRKLRSEFDLILFDRFFQDVLIDPKRYRMGYVRWWMGEMLRLAPQPDLAIILTAPATVIQSRKQEVSLEETERQLGAYRDSAKKFHRAIVLENDGPPEALAAVIIREILENG